MGLKTKLRKLLRRRQTLDQLSTRVEDMEVQWRQWMSLAELKYKFSLPPVPPKALQIRVAGAYYAAFFEHGKGMFHELQAILQSHQLNFFDFNDVLDFGCGCGRFMIPMSCMMDPKKLSGTDIDPEAIAWLKGNYSCFKDVDVNGHAPPTKYASGTFDFIFSVSIFTHLPEDMQHAWLKELSRVMKPGGHGIFTTHGEHTFSFLKEDDRKKVRGAGFHYGDFGATEGLPDFYQTSFQTPDYVRQEWAKYFDVLAICEKGIGSNQDAVLVRKRLA
jgi:cyclopropane fatty-acyl-phospholipid synthase-like methyltransferase